MNIETALCDMMKKVNEGTIMQLHSYKPDGADAYVVVAVFASSRNDLDCAGQSIERSARVDQERQLHGFTDVKTDVRLCASCASEFRQHHNK